VFTAIPRTADTSEPLLPALANRWSPRAFDSTATVPESDLTAMLEAARWSPSANNAQPWRFIVTRRGTPEFATIFDNLTGFNRAWAGNAGVLLVAVAELRDESGGEHPHAIYDLGQSIAHLSVQAHHLGLFVHQMAGFDADRMQRAFHLNDRLKAVTTVAIGHLGHAGSLPEALAKRENTPRSRIPLTDLLLVNAT